MSCVLSHGVFEVRPLRSIVTWRNDTFHDLMTLISRVNDIFWHTNIGAAIFMSSLPVISSVFAWIWYFVI